MGLSMAFIRQMACLDRLPIAMAIAYAINLVFGLGILINELKIWFYYAYVRCTVNVIFFSPFLDAAVWIISFAVIISEIGWRLVKRELRLPRQAALLLALIIVAGALMIYDFKIGMTASAITWLIVTYSLLYYSGGAPFKGRRHAIGMVLTMAMGILIVVEIGSLAAWVVNAFDHQMSFTGGGRWVFPTLDLNISNVIYPLTAWLILIFLFCWVFPPICHVISRWLHFMKEEGQDDPGNASPFVSVDWKLQSVVVLIFSALAAFVMYYPYIHFPPPYLAGIDAAHYYEYLTAMIRDGPLSALSSDRPLYLLILYGIAALGISPDIVVRIMPSASAVCLVFAVFIFVKRGASDPRLGMIAAILTSFSIQITAGMIGYFLAQLFAVIESFIFFTLLLEGVKRRSILYLILSGLTSVATALTHPYTWLLMAATTVFYALLTAITRRKAGDALLPLIPLAITGLAIIPFYIHFGEGAFNNTFFLRTLNAIWQRFISSLNISKIVLLQPSLAKMAERWVGGAFGNPLIYSLGLIGASAFYNLRGNFNRLVLSWVALASLVIFAIIPNYEGLYYRIAFFIPFQIFAASGALKVGRWIQDLFGGADVKWQSFKKIAWMAAMVLVILLMFNYALRTVDLVVMRLP